MLEKSERYSVSGNVIFRERSTLREKTLYISDAQKFENKGDDKRINFLINEIFVATEYEDGFFIDHLCYTDSYGNVFMSEDEEIQEVFERYSPSIYLMANGVVIIYTRYSLYATTDMENFSRLDVDEGIRKIHESNGIDYMELCNRTSQVINTFPDFKKGVPSLTIVSTAVQKLKNAQ